MVMSLKALPLSIVKTVKFEQRSEMNTELLLMQVHRVCWRWVEGSSSYMSGASLRSDVKSKIRVLAGGMCQQHCGSLVRVYVRKKDSYVYRNISGMK
jgi:hypothetical protein